MCTDRKYFFLIPRILQPDVVVQTLSYADAEPSSLSFS